MCVFVRNVYTTKFNEISSCFYLKMKSLSIDIKLTNGDDDSRFSSIHIITSVMFGCLGLSQQQQQQKTFK